MTPVLRVLLGEVVVGRLPQPELNRLATSPLRARVRDLVSAAAPTVVDRSLSENCRADGKDELRKSLPPDSMAYSTGRGAVWLARLLWEQEVVGSILSPRLISQSRLPPLRLVARFTSEPFEDAIGVRLRTLCLGPRSVSPARP